jgi:hypothetical protein
LWDLSNLSYGAIANGLRSEKREVTGSTPVPTTGKFQFSEHTNWQSGLDLQFRAHNVPTRNWNRFQFLLSRPFLSVSEMSQESRRVLQYAVDLAYELKSGRSPEEVRSDLITRLGQLRLELDGDEIDGWALEISEGQRIQIRIKSKSYSSAAALWDGWC